LGIFIFAALREVYAEFDFSCMEIANDRIRLKPNIVKINIWALYYFISWFFLFSFLRGNVINPIRFEFPWRFAVNIDREQKQAFVNGDKKWLRSCFEISVIFSVF